MGYEGDTIRLHNEKTVECVTLLQKSSRKPDARIKIDVNLEDYYRIKDAKKSQSVLSDEKEKE